MLQHEGGRGVADAEHAALEIDPHRGHAHGGRAGAGDSVEQRVDAVVRLAEDPHDGKAAESVNDPSLNAPRTAHETAIHETVQIPEPPDLQQPDRTVFIRHPLTPTDTLDTA